MTIRIFKILFSHFLKNYYDKSAQMCAPWFGKFLNVFENVFEVISDHIMNESNLEDFPKAKKYNITKCIAKVVYLQIF